MDRAAMKRTMKQVVIAALAGMVAGIGFATPKVLDFYAQTQTSETLVLDDTHQALPLSRLHAIRLGHHRHSH